MRSVGKALVFAGLLLTAQFVAADRDPATDQVIHDLCANGATEGRYTATLGSLGRYHIYLVCAGTDSLTAAMAKDSSAMVFATMVYSSVDDDKINFVSFKPRDDEGWEFGIRGPDPRLKLDISALKRGVLSGTYRALYTPAYIKVSAIRDATFPNLFATGDFSRDYHEQFMGQYEIVEHQLGDAQFAETATLTTDVIAGMQRITYDGGPGMAFSLFNGMIAAKAGDIFAATSGVDDDDAGSVPLVHIRGRLTGENDLEFYYFSSALGMRGPLHASRRPSGVRELLMRPFTM